LIIKPLIAYKKDRVYKVSIVPKTYVDLFSIVADCPSEIGFLATAKKIEYENGIEYSIKDIFIPEQSVNRMECEMDSESIAKIVMEYIQVGKSPNDFRCWIHSHVNMSCNPSQTDIDTMDNHVKDSEEWYIMMIVNKRKEVTIHVADKKENVYITDLPLDFKTDLDTKEILKRLRPITVAIPKTTATYYNDDWYGNLFDNSNRKTKTGKKHNRTYQEIIKQEKESQETCQEEICPFCREEYLSTVREIEDGICCKCDAEYGETI